MEFKFTSSQLDFLCSEFGIDREQIETADDKTLDDLYDKLCDIEVEETIKAGDGQLSQRGTKASELVTLMGEGE